MEILSTNIVTTRKPHLCSACHRWFDKGTKMTSQAVAYEGTVGRWRECPTCMKLLGNWPKHFDDGYGVFDPGCVNDSLNRGQTPEELLKELETLKL